MEDQFYEKYCRYHQDKYLEYICINSSCINSRICCADCILTGTQHLNHDRITINTYRKYHKECFTILMLQKQEHNQLRQDLEDYIKDRKQKIVKIFLNKVEELIQIHLLSDFDEIFNKMSNYEQIYQDIKYDIQIDQNELNQSVIQLINFYKKQVNAQDVTNNLINLDNLKYDINQKKLELQEKIQMMTNRLENTFNFYFENLLQTKCNQQFGIQGNICKQFNGHSKQINTLLHLEGSTFASGGSDEKIIIWNIDKQDNFPERIIDKLNGEVNSLAKLQKNEIVCCAGPQQSDLYIIDWQKGQILNQIKTYNNTKFLKVEYLYMFSMATISQDNYIRIWDYQKNQTNQQQKVGHTDTINDIIYLQQNLLVTCSEDSLIKLWDYTNMLEKDCYNYNSDSIFYSLNRINDITFASGTYQVLCIFNCYEKKIQLINSFQMHHTFITKILNLNYEHLVTCSNDGSIKYINRICGEITPFCKNQNQQNEQSFQICILDNKLLKTDKNYSINLFI